jgi:phage gp36-like protein
MAYSTTQDLLNRINEETLLQLADTDDDGVADEAIVQSAIADADSLINSMISPVYQVPLTSVPRVIRELSAAMAIYRLHLFRSADPGVWKDEYALALEFLQSVAAGKAALEGLVPEPPASADLSGTADFKAKERGFSRDELKEW